MQPAQTPAREGMGESRAISPKQSIRAGYQDISVSRFFGCSDLVGLAIAHMIGYLGEG